MKGLALAIVLGLACIRSNTDGMRVSVNVGINSSDEPGKHESQIVGGEPVEPHSIPWQVLQYRTAADGKTYLCGGTIICPRFVMTAAHCTAPGSSYEIYIRVHRKSQDTTEDNLVVLKKAHVHPKYNQGTAFNYDYAIMELMNPIRIFSDAKAIFLPDASDKYNDKSLFLTSGWGLTKNGGEIASDVLLSVTLPFVQHGVCKDRYSRLTPQMMCAGDMDKGKIDACKGDSGGPLAWLDPKTDQVKLSGVVSWGAGCAVPGAPGVYADVINQLEWIKEVTGNCNEQTCQAGNCMRKQDLAPSTIEKFGRMTPHRVQEAPVKGYGTGEGDNHNSSYLSYGKK